MAPTKRRSALAQTESNQYGLVMRILIRFPDEETERRALGKLIPRFSGHSRANGETAVPAYALSFLADQGISFTVIGPAPYECLTPLRDPRAIGA